MTPRSQGSRAWPFLLATLRERRRELCGFSAWLLAEGVPAFLTGRFVARATDHGFLAHRPVTGLAWLAGLAVALAFGAWATRQTTRRLAAIVEPFRDELVRRAVITALHDSVVPGAPADTAGVARLARHTEIAREALAGVLMLTQSFVVVTLGTLIGLGSLLPASLWFVLPPFVAGLMLFAVSLRWAMACQRASILADEGIAQSVASLAGGLRDVAACGGEARAAATVEPEIERLAEARRRLARVQAVRSLAVSVGGLLPLILVLLGAPWLLRRGATVGVVLGVLTYVVEGLHPALQRLVHGMGNTAAWLLVAVDRVVRGAGRPAALQRPPAGQPPIRGEALDLRGVTFRYGPWSEPVLEGFNLEIPEGDHLAVIGPSGVGKSTLAGIIAGMLHPQAGSILLGGVPVSSLGIETLAAHRVLIPQEAYVFAGTVRENLAAFCQGRVAEEELARAVAELGLAALVDRLGGWDASLRPEDLSAGERQLINAARAWLSAAPIAVLDEATCHLDPPAEAIVEEAFARRPGTLVVIAHRLSSALRARRILLMEGATCVVGTHEELLGTSALYRDLVGSWAPEEAVGVDATVAGAAW